MSRRDPRATTALIATVVLGLAVTAVFSLGRAYRSIDDPTAGLRPRPAYVSAPDPILRAEAGLDPNSTDEAPGVARPDVRTMLVSPDRIDLLAGGALVRRVPLAQPAATPDAIVDAVADDGWVRRSTSTEIVLDAALIMLPGTTLTVAAPLRRLVLGARSGLFLGGDEATLRFTGVAVEASDRDVPVAGEVGPGTRPFVLAEGGRMEITNSAFRYLGRDWSGSYGVTWAKGAGGFATGSTFARGFMGVFAATAIDVRFVGNTFADNALYGINAHQLSAGVLLERNTAERNGRDGIMLSDHVTGGVVRNNITRDNRLDGLMIDGACDRNTVTGNVAQNNGGDGIGVADSSHTTLVGNTLRGNRVAIDVYGTGVARKPGSDNVARDNVIDGNGAALQGIDATPNTVLANGDYWRPWALAAIGLGVVPLVVGLEVLTRRRRRATATAITRSNHERAIQRSGV